MHTLPPALLLLLVLLLSLVSRATHAALIVTSPCGLGRCALLPPASTGGPPGCVSGNEPACGCVASTPGVLCSECSRAGYISAQTSECVCAAPHDNQDPSIRCLPVVSVSRFQNVMSNETLVVSECFNNTVLGFFQATNTLSRYGADANPQSCQKCRNPGWGPLPGTVDDSLAGGVPSGICNQYGAFAANSSVWQACSGNGAWNATQYGCECDLGWQLSYTGYAGAVSPQTTCGAYAPGYGPGPAITTPAPNGTLEVCGGGGSYSSAANTCFCLPGWQNTTLTWEVDALAHDRNKQGNLLQITYNATVTTCTPP